MIINCIIVFKGALPDAAIIVVSTLGGDSHQVQQQLSVGMGTLAGSNVLLLTLPIAAVIWVGRTDIINKTARNKVYTKFSWTMNGITVYSDVKILARIMMVSITPYLIIQTTFIVYLIHGGDIVKEEKDWALTTAILCGLGFIAYSIYQVTNVTLQQRKLQIAKKKHIWAKFVKRLAEQMKSQVRHDTKKISEELTTPSSKRFSMPIRQKTAPSLNQAVSFQGRSLNRGKSFSNRSSSFNPNYDVLINIDEPEEFQNVVSPLTPISQRSRTSSLHPTVKYIFLIIQYP